MKKSFCLKAVMFDMDGVITDTMPYHLKAWQVVLKKAGFRVTKTQIYKREGQPGHKTIQELAAERGWRINQQMIRQILRDKEELFKKIVRPRFILGARAFIRSLACGGIRLALVTGTARHEVHRIMPKPLLDLFEVTVTGDDVRHGKPHPEPYLLALRKLGISARQAVVFENAPFGICSAKRAGVRCVALETSLPGEYLSRADFIFRTYAGVRRSLVFEANKTECSSRGRDNRRQRKGLMMKSSV